MHKIIHFIKINAIYLILIQVTISILGSLYFSDIKGYEPCVLCWYQRICIYSLFPIIIIGLLKKEKKIYHYIIPISILGLIISIYHNLLYTGIIKIEFCSGGISCTTKYIELFGFISIPFMSLLSFIIIIILALMNRKLVHENDQNIK